GFAGWRPGPEAEAQWETVKTVVRLAGLPGLGRPLTALVLGCDTGFFCHRLHRWGFAPPVGVDENADRIALARLLAGYFHRDRTSYLALDYGEFLVDGATQFDVTIASRSFTNALAERPAEERAALLGALV